jgi:hypothetical protein
VPQPPETAAAISGKPSQLITPAACPLSPEDFFIHGIFIAQGICRFFGNYTFRSSQPMRFSRVLLALPAAAILAVAVWSCRPDNSPTGVSVASTPPVSGDLVSGVVSTTTGLVGDLGLLKCTPLPYAKSSATIGPLGGTLQIGQNTLTVPAGALTQSVQITGEQLSDTVNSVQFSPQGLQFAKPASLSMPYANCNLLGRLLPKQIAYTTDNLQILTYLLSIDNLSSKTVTGQVNHFSRYAVAW